MMNKNKKDIIYNLKKINNSKFVENFCCICFDEESIENPFTPFNCGNRHINYLHFNCKSHIIENKCPICRNTFLDKEDFKILCILRVSQLYNLNFLKRARDIILRINDNNLLEFLKRKYNKNSYLYRENREIESLKTQEKNRQLDRQRKEIEKNFDNKIKRDNEIQQQTIIEEQNKTRIDEQNLKRDEERIKEEIIIENVKYLIIIIAIVFFLVYFTISNDL